MGEMRQHSQDATVAALVLVDVQLPEDRAHVSFDGALADDELPGYRRIGLAFGGQLENLALTRAQVADRIVTAGLVALGHYVAARRRTKAATLNLDSVPS